MCMCVHAHVCANMPNHVTGGCSTPQVVRHLQSITGIASESIAEFSYAVLTHGVGVSPTAVPPLQAAWAPALLSPPAAQRVGHRLQRPPASLAE